MHDAASLQDGRKTSGDTQRSKGATLFEPEPEPMEEAKVEEEEVKIVLSPHKVDLRKYQRASPEKRLRQGGATSQDEVADKDDDNAN